MSLILQNMSGLQNKVHGTYSSLKAPSLTLLNAFHMKENRALPDSHLFPFVFCQNPQPHSQKDKNWTGSMAPTRIQQNVK